MPLVPIILYVGFCFLVAWTGRDRRFGYWGYFFASVLLTPAIGILLVWSSYPSAALTEGSKDRIASI